MMNNHQIVNIKEGADLGEFNAYREGILKGRIGGALGGTVISGLVTGVVVLGGAAAASPVLIGGAVAVTSFTMLASLGAGLGGFVGGFKGAERGRSTGELAAKSGKNKEEIIQLAKQDGAEEGLLFGTATGLATGAAVVGVTAAAGYVVINKPDLIITSVVTGVARTGVNPATATEATATTDTTATTAATAAVLIGAVFTQSDDSGIDSDVMGEEMHNDNIPLIGGA